MTLVMYDLRVSEQFGHRHSTIETDENYTFLLVIYSWKVVNK